LPFVLFSEASPFPSLFCSCPPILSDSGTSEGWLVDTGLGILWLGLKMTVWSSKPRFAKAGLVVLRLGWLTPIWGFCGWVR
ncbi:hypothetical protein VIGAN_04137500, partial [Vigna angularis var. angularis]